MKELIINNKITPILLNFRYILKISTVVKYNSK